MLSLHGESFSPTWRLAKKKRSVKRKPPSSPEGCSPAQGKTLKVGTSPSPSSAVGAGDSSGRADEPPLEVLPISVWSPTSRGAAPPPKMLDEVTGNRDRFEAAGDEDSLLSHAVLAVGAVSSILHDSDLRRVGALPVEEALASQRGEVITKLKDEACTQWAFGWLAFQHRASRAFPDLEFNIHLSDEEVEGSTSEAEVDAGAKVFSGAPDRSPLPGDSRVPPEGSSYASPAGAPLLDSSTSASRGPMSSV